MSHTTVAVCIIAAVWLGWGLGYLFPAPPAEAHHATPPPSGPCDFPDEGPEPDQPAIQAMGDIMSHGPWTNDGQAYLTVEESGDKCLLTIGLSTYEVEALYTTAPRVALVGANVSLDIDSDGQGGWKLGCVGSPFNSWMVDLTIDTEQDTWKHDVSACP